jgi:hypothetical protein
MRIWSLHPKYLDTKGLLALWRETLLAKHVLEGKTRGYTNHPQLKRFKLARRPQDCINRYLVIVHKEASNRGYVFDKSKIGLEMEIETLPVTDGQVKYEVGHLLNKLKARDPERYARVKALEEFETHPLFQVIPGNIEDWEVTK